ncbi:MAG: GGDEF domain-containing protein [Kangiellaceae bacterium]|nr:GGDEF domain-containing protein [Kangiellaceae bacterium]MCW9000704.1 GGDEF domain-containing protein [Kangiellaceae bacterium]MCW9015743.1 GGDEF domain-containing protein [Kangiellaceae bacterium]
MNPVLFVQLAIVFTSATLAIIFFMAWQTMGRKKYTLLWSLTFVVIVIQRMFNIYKEDFSSFTLYWMVVCVLSLLSVGFGAWGHILRTKSKVSMNLIWLSSVVVFALTFYFTAIYQHTGLSMSLYVYHNAIVLFVVGVVIFNYRDKTPPAELGASISYILLGGFQFMAGTFALLQGQELNQFYRELYTYLNLVTLPAAFTAMGLFVVFMLASDLSENMKSLAMTDSLTQCSNRRGFFNKAEKMVSDLLGKSQQVGIILWDIDKFKSVNDQYGHSVGDRVLVEIADLVREYIDQQDLLGRMGGEEFVILLSRPQRDEARSTAEILRKVIENHAIKLEQNKIKVTASFGVVFFEDGNTDVEKAIDIADNALYRAKEDGRNRVVFVN